MSEDTSSPIGPLNRLQRLALAGALLVFVTVIGGAIFVWSGYYNVAANTQHLRLTNWLLAVIRDQSIRTYARDIKVPDLSDPGLARLGERHYVEGCAFCHAMPGAPQNPAVKFMLPAPPDLKYASDDYPPNELHWIINNGLKFTGMPGWPASERGDEVWSLVAYLLEAGRDDSESQPPEPQSEEETVVPEAAQISSATGGDAVVRLARQAGCSGCHGDADSAPVSAETPSLNGQSESYLLRSLREYEEGTRRSGFMRVALDGLGDEELVALAGYYAGLSPAKGESEPGDGSALGRQIATEGLPETGVPACLACHSGTGAQLFSSLDGQAAEYLEQQLLLWQKDVRSQTGYGAIMAPIAQRMSTAEIEAVSRYFAGRRGEGEP